MEDSISRDPDVLPSDKAGKAALRQRLMALRHSAGQSASAIANGGSGSSASVQAMALPDRLQHTITPASPQVLQQAFNERLAACLERLAPRCVAFYWPISDEVDLRDSIAQWLARDAQQASMHPRTAALPVVIGKRAPMAFHRWDADMPMQEGMFRIQVPARINVATPDLLLVPCVGFDERCYRLGYGGGFYDRTLAAMAPRPATLGIALSCTGMPLLPSEAHDIPLDGILTEDRALGLVATVF